MQCDHETIVELDWTSAVEVEPGIVVIGGKCVDCGDYVKTKLERRGTVSRSDFYLEGLEAF